MKILHVVGARPNFMKASPVLAAIEQYGFADQVLLHTGQHYDRSMSQVFFEELQLRPPDVNLEVGSGSHAEQTAAIMVRYEKVVAHDKPDLVLVYGDVNSTLAASLVCAKLGIPVGHVEAGLRSRDRAMPEEINRILTDQISDLLFTPSSDANANLLAEGIAPEKIHFVGNVMIDTLVRLLPLAERSSVLNRLGLAEQGGQRAPYVLVTLHRPSNVDDSSYLQELLDGLQHIGRRISVVFPIHPRTRQRIESIGWRPDAERIKLIEPLGYLDFLALQRQAAAIVTDSGGVQEESTYLGVPCLTMRTTTERPVTVEMGSNLLLGEDPKQMVLEVENILNGRCKSSRIPPKWDGAAAIRIAEVIQTWWTGC